MFQIALEVLLRIVGWFLEKNQADAEAKRRFYAFVESMSKDSKVSATLRDSYLRQLERSKKNDT